MSNPIFHSQYTAAQIETAIGKGPRVNANGYWEVWNVANMAYESTGVGAGVTPPTVVTQVSQMTNHGYVYIYNGSETGYTPGYWYYWDGSAWTAGGAYQSAPVDPTLSVAGAAADAKATGDAVGKLKSDMKDITGNYEYTWDKNSTRDLPNVLNKTTYSNWVSVLVSCSAGDVFYVKGSGGNNSRLYIFADSTGAPVTDGTSASQQKWADYHKIVAPTGTSYLACNSRTNDGSYVPGLISGTPIDLRTSELEAQIPLIYAENNTHQCVFGKTLSVFNGATSPTVTNTSPTEYRTTVKNKLTATSSTVAILRRIDDKSRSLFSISTTGTSFKLAAYIKLITEGSPVILQMILTTSAYGWGAAQKHAMSGNVTVSKSGLYVFDMTASDNTTGTDSSTEYYYAGLAIGGSAKNPNIDYYEVFNNPDLWADINSMKSDVANTEKYSSLAYKENTTHQYIFNNTEAVYNGSNSPTISSNLDIGYRVTAKSKLTATSGTVALLRGVDEKSKTLLQIPANSTKFKVAVFVKLLEEYSSVYIQIIMTTSAYGWGTAYKRAVSGTISISKSGLYVFDMTASDNTTGTDSSTQYNYLGLAIGGSTRNPNVDYIEVFTNPDLWHSINQKLNDAVPSYGRDLICWGDSLTAGAGGNGTTYPNVCANELGITVANYGVGGETANTISARQGGNTIWIPAGNINGTYTINQLADIFGYHVNPLRQGSGGGSGSTLYIDGDACTLEISQSTSTSDDAIYTISGYTGSAKSVPTLARFIGSDYSGRIVTIWVGANGTHVGSDTTVTARMAVIDSMIKHIGHNRYVVFGNWTSTGTKAGFEEDDKAMLKHYGNKFFPVRQMLVDYGLTLMGIAPTSQDIADISNGKIPTSLRSDGIHLNSSGYTAVGKFLAEKIRSLGYV